MRWRPPIFRSHPSRTRLWCLLVLAAVVRVAALPNRYDVRDIDELGYLQGGLQLIEGLPPPLHYAPAGPETWVGWVHVAAASCRYAVWPTAEERRVPLEVRPFTAVNHALFDVYRDMSSLRMEFIALSVIVSLTAVAAGFTLGSRWGGEPGALLLGGLAAFIPLLIEQDTLAKPYGLAWSLAVIAIYLLARGGRRGRIVSAICLGLSIGSRIEMAAVLPLALCALAAARTGRGPYRRTILRYLGTTAVATLLVAPWLLTHAVGNLRAIATVRFGPPPGPRIGWVEMLGASLGGQGLGVVAALVVAGAVLRLIGRPRLQNSGADASADAGAPTGVWWWLIVLYALLLFSTIVQNTGYGLRHHGPAVVCLLVASPLAVGVLRRRWPRATWGLVGLAVALPLVRAGMWVWAERSSARPEDATAWIEAHVPAATIVYTSSTFHDPLPTPRSADALWNEVAGIDTAERKFRAGLARFGLRDTQMPRALSEQMMIVERAGPRRWYILGSRADLAGPRYDVRPFRNSAVFGLQDPLPAFARTGGVLVWRANGPAPGLPPPFKVWANRNDAGTYLYLSADVGRKLRPRVINIISPGL